MRHSGINKKLFSLVFGIVITVPFVLQGIGHKGWDPIGQAFGLGGASLTAGSSVIIDQVAKQDIDPSIVSANATASQAGRATTLDDVWGALSDFGVATNPDAPVNPNAPIITSPDSSLSGVNSNPTNFIPVFTNQGNSIHVVFNALGVPGICDITINPVTNIAVRTCKSGTK